MMGKARVPSTHAHAQHQWSVLMLLFLKAFLSLSLLHENKIQIFMGGACMPRLFLFHMSTQQLFTE